MTDRLATFAMLDSDRLDGCIALLEKHLGIRVPGALDAAHAAEWARAVEAAEDDWVEDFGGDQHCLGRAYYTHLEEDRLDAYFDDAEETNERVEAHLPGLQAAMRTLVARITGGQVRHRETFCGAGVHVFSPGKWLSHNGGDVHFDTEGLEDEDRDRGARALTLVLMLQPARTGGGLRVWDVRFQGSDTVTRAMLAKPSALVTYGVGELFVLDSYRLHQIQPFGGEGRRISATLHAVETTDGVWDTWF